MAICQIWEVYSSGNNRQQVAMLPGGVPKNVTISSTHAETAAALDNATIAIEIQTDTDCWFKLYKSGAPSPLGDVATAANGKRLLAAHGILYYGVPLAAGVSVSIITA